ncbi:hypothetical protein quinque_011073 [Culex quinquefasciatus]
MWKLGCFDFEDVSLRSSVSAGVILVNDEHYAKKCDQIRNTCQNFFGLFWRSWNRHHNHGCFAELIHGGCTQIARRQRASPTFGFGSNDV